MVSLTHVSRLMRVNWGAALVVVVAALCCCTVLVPPPELGQPFLRSLRHNIGQIVNP